MTDTGLLVLHRKPCANEPSSPVNEPYKETSGTAQLQQAIDSPDPTCLRGQTPQLWWVARTPVPLMQQCPMNHG